MREGALSRCSDKAFPVHYSALMKNEQTAALGAVIGDRVRTERQARSWTLDRLAERAGVSRRMIINIEQGATNPSVATLLRISDALGVGLPALVALPEPGLVTVTRPEDRTALWTGSAGGRAYLTAGLEPPNVVELWDWTLEPGDRHHSESHSRETRELLLVLEGAVTLEVAGERYDLETGDAASFPGDVAHGYHNPSTHRTRFALTVFQPDVGTGRAHV